jgi:hypothetical protein
MFPVAKMRQSTKTESLKEGARMIAALFWLFLASSSAALLMFGDQVAKIFLAILLAGVVGTYLLTNNLGWQEAQIYILYIDSAILIVALLLVSKARVYWPIWVSAFQAIVVATSLAHLIFPNHIPGIYINLQGFWFFPALMSLVIGVILDARTEQANR